MWGDSGCLGMCTEQVKWREGCDLLYIILAKEGKEIEQNVGQS